MASGADLQLKRDPLITKSKWRFADKTKYADEPTISKCDEEAILQAFDAENTNGVVDLSGLANILSSLKIDLNPTLQDQFIEPYLAKRRISLELEEEKTDHIEEKVSNYEEADDSSDEEKKSQEEGEENEEATESIAEEEGKEDIDTNISNGTKDVLNLEEVKEIIGEMFAPPYVFGRDLRRAVARGDLDATRELVWRGCYPNRADGRGMNAIHYAAEAGDLSSMKCLIENCPEIDCHKQDRCGWTPLICAAANGHEDVVKEIYSKGNIPTDELANLTRRKRSALHWAALKGKQSIAKLLLQQGSIDKNGTDSAGLTALHCAAINGDPEMIKLLIRSGVDPNIQDNCGIKAITYCLDDKSLVQAFGKK